MLPINERVPRPIRPRTIREARQYLSPTSLLSDAAIKFPTNVIPKEQRAVFRRKRKLAQYHLTLNLRQESSEHIDELVDEIVAGALSTDASNATQSRKEALSSNEMYDRNVDFRFEYGLTQSDITIPHILQTMDVSQFGPSLFVYCLHALQTKDRPAIWIVLQFIISHLPTAVTVRLFNKYKNVILRFSTDNVNKLCLKIIDSAAYPIATALYLSGFMASCSENCESDDRDEFAMLYTNIAIKLCTQIESDHLLAIILEIPSNIWSKSILEIAVEYKLIDFLYCDRLRPIFNRMWTEFVYLDPSFTFQMNSPSSNGLFELLRWTPSHFYYSPQGQFILNLFFYILYVFIFTLWLMELQYPYDLSLSTTESILWIFNVGYAAQEAMQMIYRTNRYLIYLSTYWDLLIVLNWMVIAFIRWPCTLFSEDYVIYDDDGNIDEPVTRNQPLSIAYMVFVGFQSVLVWTRFLIPLQRSKKTGRLIQTMIRLVSDVWQFCIVLLLFLIGCMFALYYLIGGDIVEEGEDGCDFGSIYTLLLFTFQALLGQHDWSILKPSSDNGFGVERSRTAEALVVMFSIMGNIGLLNLLIALMASVYEQNSPLTAKQVHFAQIVNTVELVEKEAILPPPFNLMVIVGAVIYFMVETMIKCLSCSHRTYNITKLNPTDYALNRDWILLETKDTETENNKSNGSYTAITNNQQNGYISGSHSDDKGAGDGETEHKYDIHQNGSDTRNGNNGKEMDEMTLKYETQQEILRFRDTFWEESSSSSRKCTRSEKIYCRFCRNRVNINGDITVYFALCQHYRALDESDKRLLLNMLQNKIICPFCFRPITFYEDTRDSTRLWRWQVLMEIFSFYIFMVVAYIPLTIILAIPSIISGIKCYRLNIGDENVSVGHLHGNNVIFGEPLNGDEYQKPSVAAAIYSEYDQYLQRRHRIVRPSNGTQECLNNDGDNHAGDATNNDGHCHAVHPIQSRLAMNAKNSMLSPTVDSREQDLLKEMMNQLTDLKKEMIKLQSKNGESRRKQQGDVNAPTHTTPSLI